MQRILVALPVLTSVDIVHRWVAELALAGGSTVTAVTMIRSDAWREGLPPVITAGFGAVLAEMRPWTTADEPIARIEDRFSQLCDETGIRLEIDKDDGPPERRLVQLAPFHDVLVIGLPPVGNHETDRVLERELRTSGSGIPVIRVVDRPGPVTRVLILLNQDSSSLRALRAFLHLRPWPEAAVSVTAYGVSERHSEMAAAYCAAHGVAASVLPYGERDEIADWILREHVGVVVTGWPWFHGPELTTRSADETLPSLFVAA